MTGPAHYAEAERLLTQASGTGAGLEPLVARAAVHAQLAQVAAIAELFAHGRGDSDAEEWRGTIRR